MHCPIRRGTRCWMCPWHRGIRVCSAAQTGREKHVPVLKRKPATYQDIQELPTHMVGEIVDGELRASPRPPTPHARVSSVLGGELVGPFDSGKGCPGGWWILDEPELHLSKDVLVPDLACEVLSPGMESWDRIRKMRIYGREHVSNVWLANPMERTLEVFRLTDAGYLQVGAYLGEERVRAEPFEAVELDLGGLWLPEQAGETQGP
jgi:Uma2 family endonuclease